MTHRVAFSPYLHASQTFEILVHVLDQPAARFPSFDMQPPPLEPCSEFLSRTAATWSIHGGF